MKRKTDPARARVSRRPGRNSRPGRIHRGQSGRGDDDARARRLRLFGRHRRRGLKRARDSDLDGRNRRFDLGPADLSRSENLENPLLRGSGRARYFGAKVLHPKTIQPAVDLQIPVRVCNSREPAERGTMICLRRRRRRAWSNRSPIKKASPFCTSLRRGCSAPTDL
jgi:hypothetical protein